MVTYNEAKKIILKKHKESIIVSAMELKSGYLFSLKPRNWNKGVLLDPFFKVSFDGKVSEYSPVMDPEEFKYALSHVIGENQNE